MKFMVIWGFALVAAFVVSSAEARKLSAKSASLTSTTCEVCPKPKSKERICATDSQSQTKDFASECEMKRANCVAQKNEYTIQKKGSCIKNQIIDKFQAVINDESKSNWMAKAEEFGKNLFGGTNKQEMRGNLAAIGDFMQQQQVSGGPVMNDESKLNWMGKAEEFGKNLFSGTNKQDMQSNLAAIGDFMQQQQVSGGQQTVKQSDANSMGNLMDSAKQMFSKYKSNRN